MQLDQKLKRHRFPLSIISQTMCQLNGVDPEAYLADVVMRWKIEVFHKILKSGLHVEQCRLGTAERLIRYLTVMSIIGWKLFFITLLARTNPGIYCTTFAIRGRMEGTVFENTQDEELSKDTNAYKRCYPVDCVV